jgi:hypothetical protein
MNRHKRMLQNAYRDGKRERISGFQGVLPAGISDNNKNACRMVRRAGAALSYLLYFVA